MGKKKMHYMTMLNLVVIGNVLSTILIIGIIFGTVYYRYMKEEVITSLENDVGQAESYMSSYIESITNTAEKLAMDVELGVAVEDYLSSDISRSVNGKGMIDYILQSALSMNSSIENITIGTKDMIIQRDGYSIDKDSHMDIICNETWYKEIQKDKLERKFAENTFYKNTYGQKPYYLYATKFKNKFYQTRDQEDRVIIITFNTTELEKHISTLTNNAVINIHIWWEDNGEKKLVYQAEEQKDVENYLIGNPDAREKAKVEAGYVFTQRETPAIGWHIVGNINKSTFYRLAYQVEPWMVLIILGVIGISVILSAVSSQAVSKPMKKLVAAMEDIENSEFHRVDSNTSCIETDKLIFTYNRMAGRIEGLIEDIKMREAEKRKIEFKVLEAQINPHFIYNTLDAVKWVARVNQSDKIADIIESFVRLLRISLSRGREMISVSNEIILIREYANIMIFRNNYEIEIHYEIAEDTRSLSTLKLVLQPFVENCFFHAFNSEVREKHITVRSRQEEDALVFEVTDNGIGFCMKNKNMKQMTGIGIDNIDERIKAWHGNGYGVEILTGEDRGTTIRIRQPIIKEEIG